MEKFVKVYPNNPEKITPEDFMKLQDRLEAVFREYTERIQNDSFIIGPVKIATGSDQFIEHKLGREWSGWIIIDQDSHGVLRTDVTTEYDKTKFIGFNTNGTANFTLLVF